MEQSYAPYLDPLPEVKTWVDLGCNAGLFSLYLENWARERGWAGPRKALLVDANRYALRSVRTSIDLNHFRESFHVAEAAVGPKTGYIDFFESKSTYKSSVFKLASKERSRRVPVVDLAAASRFLGPRIDLVKADIEGGEKLLLENWGNWLKSANHLIIEWHEPYMKGRELDRLCAQLGFRLVVAKPPDYLKKETCPALDLPIGSGLWANQHMEQKSA